MILWRRVAVALGLLALLASSSAAQPPGTNTAAKAAALQSVLMQADKAIAAGDISGAYSLSMLAMNGYDVAAHLPAALQLVQKQASTGDDKAITRLGEWYEHGFGGPVDYSAALTWYRRGAAAGNAFAMNHIGVFYTNGLAGLPHDDAQALNWYLKAAQKGDAVGEMNVACAYLDGMGAARDLAAARHWAELSQVQGYGPADGLLGYMLYSGLGGPVDLKRAAAVWLEGAKKSDAKSEQDLGSMLTNGTVVRINLVQARLLFTDAARQNLPEAQASLASMEDFDPAATNYEEGLMLARKAVAAKLPRAYGILANFYLHGHGVPADPAYALALYKQCAELDDRVCAAQLGLMYTEGTGVPVNDALAFKWTKHAVDLGVTQVLVNLAGLYHEGRGVARDDDMAKQLALQAMAMDHGGLVALNLGMLKERQARTVADFSEAVVFYQRASDLGLPEGRERLGGMYMSGRGVGRDDVKGAELVKAAADQGLASAQTTYGVLLVGGIGTIKDRAAALHWFKLAADQGDAVARKDYETVSKAQDTYESLKRSSEERASRNHFGWRYRAVEPTFLLNLISGY
jgi:TPR repeat protein